MNKTPTDSSSRLDKLVADSRRAQDERALSYRGRALKMYPWVCGRCSREFTPKTVQELTVHHKDHNHDNNPADGSNWELLCVYCHDNEHAKYENRQYTTGTDIREEAAKPATSKAFADLKAMMERGKG